MTTGVTAKILEETVSVPLYTLSDADLKDAFVSRLSRWTDSRWRLDNPTPGAKPDQSTISWEVELPDGRSLIDSHHAPLLDWLKRFAWSLFTTPRNNGAMRKPASASHLSVALRYLANWMVDTNRRWPSEIDSDAVTEYFDDLKSMRLLRDEDDDQIASEASISVVRNRVQILVYLWEQRAALKAAGLTPPPHDPSGGRGANPIAKEITRDRPGWIPPLPDEVALAVMNTASDFLETPARDILALHKECHAAHGHGPGSSKAARTVRARRVAEAFEFSCRPGETLPWRSQLQPVTFLRSAHTYADGRIVRKSTGNSENNLTFNIMQQVRHLVSDLTHACILVIQSTTGMRMSEICGLPSGIDLNTGLPACVRLEDSATGLNELFIVRTRLSKTESTPRSVDWVLGMRPKVRDTEADVWPPAVRALLTLDELLQPYRTIAGQDDLIVSFGGHRGLPKTSSGISYAKSEYLLRGMRDFVARYIDWSSLPDESRQRLEANDLVPYKETCGRAIRSHQWRKLFANFAVRTDPGLLPTLQMHFHHISVAMTEGGYVGGDINLLNDIQHARDQLTARYMWEISRGQVSLENLGHAGRQINHSISEHLTPRTQGQPADIAWRETVRFSEEFGATFAFSPYATCAAYLLSEMRCHQEAGTTALARWRHGLEPNYAHRRPQICAGCKNAVFDTRHLPFWLTRYTEYYRAVQQARSTGEVAGLNVFEARMTQARNILRQLGEDVESFDANLNNEQTTSEETSGA